MNKEHYQSHKAQERQYWYKWYQEHREQRKEYNRKHFDRTRNLRRTPKEWRAQAIAEKIPLAQFCEICPENDLKKATKRHHFSYDYPELFLSCCGSCHLYIHNGVDSNI